MNRGIEWPADSKTKKVSTTSSGKQVWLSSLSALTDETTDYHFDLDSNLVNQARSLSSKIKQIPNNKWRHGYIPLLVEHARLMAESPSHAVIEMSERGLNELNSLMTMERDGHISSAKDAVLLQSEQGYKTTKPFQTVSLNGCKKSSSTDQFELGAPRRTPNDDKNRIIKGDDMKSQLKAWADYGCIEPSCVVSGSDIANIEDLSDMVKDKVFVLLGATSALGPMSTLLKMNGATIAAIARPGMKIQALMERVKTEALDSVTVLFPSRKDDESGTVVGADIIDDTPELARWVANLSPEKQLVLVCLTYLDGEKHVRASVGMDLICEYACSQRKNTALSYIVSPATAHLAPMSAIEDSTKKRNNETPLWHKPFSFLQLGFRNPDITLTTNIPKYCVFNGLADTQGPNYALAKTTQQWRAMLAHSKGHVVSANHGPPSRTDSMVSHSNISIFLEGMQSFQPLVAFDVHPASSLMAALMLWDLNFEKSTAHSYESLKHPMCLFVENAAHGGSWRCPYDLSSIATFSYLIGQMTESGKSPDGSLAK